MQHKREARGADDEAAALVVAIGLKAFLVALVLVHDRVQGALGLRRVVRARPP